MNNNNNDDEQLKKELDSFRRSPLADAPPMYESTYTPSASDLSAPITQPSSSSAPYFANTQAEPYAYQPSAYQITSGPSASAYQYQSSPIQSESYYAPPQNQAPYPPTVQSASYQVASYGVVGGSTSPYQYQYTTPVVSSTPAYAVVSQDPPQQDQKSPYVVIPMDNNTTQMPSTDYAMPSSSVQATPQVMPLSQPEKTGAPPSNIVLFAAKVSSLVITPQVQETTAIRPLTEQGSTQKALFFLGFWYL